jgi:hypothetical protein
VLDKLQDVEGLKALRVEQAERAAWIEQERRKEEARRREIEPRKYRCPGCRNVIILTPEEYKRGLGYKVRPRSSYDCPYCAENDSAYRDQGHKGSCAASLIGSPLPEITLVFVRLDHVAGRHRKPESQPDVSGCETSRNRLRCSPPRQHQSSTCQLEPF